MNNIPVYPRLVSKVRRQAERFFGYYGCKPNAVLLGTDMLGAIVERGTTGNEIHTDDLGAVFLDGLRVIPDGRAPGGISVALVE
jgi:hypothetical protein